MKVSRQEFLATLGAVAASAAGRPRADVQPPEGTEAGQPPRARPGPAETDGNVVLRTERRGSDRQLHLPLPGDPQRLPTWTWERTIRWR